MMAESRQKDNSVWIDSFDRLSKHLHTYIHIRAGVFSMFTAIYLQKKILFRKFSQGFYLAKFRKNETLAKG